MLPHIITVDDIYPLMLEEICHRARSFKKCRNGETSYDWRELTNTLRGRLMVTDFFEPSTRTRLSFEAAMSYLGGSVIGTENAAEFSSFAKGESLEDNFRVLSGYCDIIVARFKNEGEARKSSLSCSVPLINGGDGKGEHPTQALIDYFSIYEQFGHYEKKRVAFLGDNLRSRTVQSLARLLAPEKYVEKIRFISPNQLKPTDDFHNEIAFRTERTDAIVESHGFLGDYLRPQSTAILELIADSNIIYVTRSQSERGGTEFRDTNVFDGLAFQPEYLNVLPKKAIILHPLPRNDELPRSIDHDPRAYYFEQARNGLFVRMALLDWLFERSDRW